MAYPQGTSARVQRLTALVAMVLVAATIAVAFGRIYVGSAATWRLLAFALGSALIAWALERRSVALAVVLSIGGLLVATGVLLFNDTTWFALPTSDTLRAMGEAARAVGEEARLRISPTEPIAPLMLATAAAVWAAIFSCHALAFRAGSPLLALVPPVALVAFADSLLDELEEPLYGVFFLVAGLAVIFADSVRRVQGWGPVWGGASRRDGFLVASGRGARRIGAGVVVVALVAPLFVPGFGSRAVIDLSSVPDDGRFNVSPLVSVASRLTAGEVVDVYSVQTDAPSYWRMTALERYDGVRWQASELVGADIPAGAPIGSPGDEFTTAVITVERDLGFSWLPVPYRPASLDIDASFEPVTSTVTGDGPLDAGDSYQVTAAYVSPDREALRGEVFSGPEAYGDLLGLPDETRDEFRAIALSWTEGATTAFDQIVAIQEHLLDTTQFRYDTQVSLREDSAALLDFLTLDRRGFCVQFASAMAALLRSIDIPARVAMGFTPGTRVASTDRWIVRSDNLHVWVEVQFPTFGWLAFEPTQGRANPATASYLASAPIGGGGRGFGAGEICPPRVDPAVCRGTDVGSGNDPTPTPSVGPSPELESVGDPGTPLPIPLVVGGALVAVALGLVAGPWLRVARRRRRLRQAAGDARRSILVTYDVMTERAAALGMPRSPGETPREYLDKALATGRIPDDHLGALTSLTVRAAYAPDEPPLADAASAGEHADTVVDELRRSTSIRERLVATYRRR